MSDAEFRKGFYGKRSDGSPKGNGWLGPIQRRDGNVSTELSMRYDDVIGGKEFPLLVPTLDQDEINAIAAGGEPPQSAIDKAIRHAVDRDAKGLSPFKD